MDGFLKWPQEPSGSYYRGQPVLNWHDLLLATFLSINIVIYIIKKLIKIENEMIFIILALFSIIFACFILIYYT